MSKRELDYKRLPEPVEIQSGCKVSWYYYADKATAEAAAIIARHNAEIDLRLGYDFGFCCPGTISGPGKHNFRPDLYEVCTS